MSCHNKREFIGQLVRSQSGERTADYSYDQSGNLLNKAGQSHVNKGWQVASITAAGKTRTFEYTPDGHISKEVDGSSLQATRTMSYDVLGRMTTLNSNTNFVYDYSGRMIKASRGDGSVTYYPTEGYEVTVRGSTTTQTAHLLYQTRHASISTESNKSPSILYYHHDHLDSVIAIFDGEGKVATTYAYDEFGETTVTSGTDLSRYKFSGKEEFDGLYYFGARFYDPKVRIVSLRIPISSQDSNES
jgi:hypothetical protein